MACWGQLATRPARAHHRIPARRTWSGAVFFAVAVLVLAWAAHGAAASHAEQARQAASGRTEAESIQNLRANAEGARGDAVGGRAMAAEERPAREAWVAGAGDALTETHDADTAPEDGEVVDDDVISGEYEMDGRESGGGESDEQEAGNAREHSDAQQGGADGAMDMEAVDVEEMDIEAALVDCLAALELEKGCLPPPPLQGDMSQLESACVHVVSWRAGLVSAASHGDGEEEAEGTDGDDDSAVEEHARGAHGGAADALDSAALLTMPLVRTWDQAAMHAHERLARLYFGAAIELEAAHGSPGAIADAAAGHAFTALHYAGESAQWGPLDASNGGLALESGVCSAAAVLARLSITLPLHRALHALAANDSSAVSPFAARAASQALVRAYGEAGHAEASAVVAADPQLRACAGVHSDSASTEDLSRCTRDVLDALGPAAALPRDGLALDSSFSALSRQVAERCCREKVGAAQPARSVMQCSASHGGVAGVACTGGEECAQACALWYARAADLHRLGQYARSRCALSNAAAFAAFPAVDKELEGTAVAWRPVRRYEAVLRSDAGKHGKREWSPYKRRDTAPAWAGARTAPLHRVSASPDARNATAVHAAIGSVRPAALQRTADGVWRMFFGAAPGTASSHGHCADSAAHDATGCAGPLSRVWLGAAPPGALARSATDALERAGAGCPLDAPAPEGSGALAEQPPAHPRLLFIAPPGEPADDGVAVDWIVGDALPRVMALAEAGAFGADVGRALDPCAHVPAGSAAHKALEAAHACFRAGEMHDTAGPPAALVIATDSRVGTAFAEIARQAGIPESLLVEVDSASPIAAEEVSVLSWRWERGEWDGSGYEALEGDEALDEAEFAESGMLYAPAAALLQARWRALSAARLADRAMLDALEDRLVVLVHCGGGSAGAAADAKRALERTFGRRVREVTLAGEGSADGAAALNHAAAQLQRAAVIVSIDDGARAALMLAANAAALVQVAPCEGGQRGVDADAARSPLLAYTADALGVQYYEPPLACVRVDRTGRSSLSSSAAAAMADAAAYAYGGEHAPAVSRVETALEHAEADDTEASLASAYLRNGSRSDAEHAAGTGKGDDAAADGRRYLGAERWARAQLSYSRCEATDSWARWVLCQLGVEEEEAQRAYASFGVVLASAVVGGVLAMLVRYRRARGQRTAESGSGSARAKRRRN